MDLNPDMFRYALLLSAIYAAIRKKIVAAKDAAQAAGRVVEYTAKMLPRSGDKTFRYDVIA